MPINNARNLKCWQLANKLRTHVIAICAIEAVKNDFRFCNGFRDAAGSVCRNLSEGFGRFTSGYIVQFFGYALASLEEIEDYLEESRIRKVIDQERFDRLYDLAEHTKASTLNFQRPHQKRLEQERKRSRSSKRRKPSARST